MTETLYHIHEELDDAIPLDVAIAELYPDKTSMEISGMILKSVRQDNNLTQAELAKLVGTSRTAIAAMESGKRSISKTMAKKFEKTFNTAWTAFL
jgi:DNA-binding XRE family transcriptional regulator